MADRKEYDKRYKEKRKEESFVVTFNMNKESDVLIYNKFLEIKGVNNTSNSQTIKNLIMEKNI